MKLNVRRWGDGDKLAVLVHGLFSDSRCWHRLGPALADRGYTVLAPDLRGHGESPRGRYSILDWSLDVLETVPHGADLAIGHSLGGLVLGVTALPLGVDQKVYLDPAWRMTAEQDRASRTEWASWLEWDSPESLRTTLGSRWPDEDLALRWDSMLKTDPGVIPGLATGTGYDVSPEQQVGRSLVLAADPSAFITPEHAPVLHERGLEVQTVPGSGHSTFREDFEGFLTILDDWRAA